MLARQSLICWMLALPLSLAYSAERHEHVESASAKATPVAAPAGPTGPPGGAVAYWSFDGADKTVVRDGAGGGRHGAIGVDVRGKDAGLPAGADRPASISLWFNPGGGTHAQVLFGYGTTQRKRRSQCEMGRFATARRWLAVRSASRSATSWHLRRSI